jgi:hypothetical protein
MTRTRSLALLALALFALVGCSQPTDDTPNEPRRVEVAGNPFAPTRHYEPDENGALVSGRVDAALVPAGTRFRALLQSAAKSPSRSASMWSTDGTFTFEDVPPGDWRVNVHTATVSDSWTWNANVAGLESDETRDLGTLELLPTQITVRARIERAEGSGPRPDGVTEADSHIEVDVDAPFMKPRWLSLGRASVAAEQLEHVFHGLPREQIALTHEARAPLMPSQRLIAGRQDEQVRLSDAPVVFEFVSTIESGPVPRPHVRFPVPIELVQLGSPWAHNSISCSDGTRARQARFDTLETQGYAYAELAVGTAHYTVALEFGRGAKRLFFHGSIEVPEGLNIGYDAEATPAVAVQLVVPAELEGDDANLRLYSPSEQRFGIQYDSGASKITVDEPTGERRIAIAELPVGWTVRTGDKAPFEWLIPAEGGRVLSRARE